MKLRWRCVVLSPVAFPLVLLGCPQGAGVGAPRQDGGADADAHADADVDGDAAGEDAPSDAAEDAHRSSGALCGNNGEDLCGPFAVCDATLGCVECERDGDCPAAAGRCLEGRCVACRPNEATDCPAGKACFSTDFSCHARCAGATSCPDGATCDETSGRCVGCLIDADCNSGVCSPVTRRCVECVTDATCPAARPRCRRFTGACVACASNDDCGVAAPICDATTFTCREGCASDAQCPGKACDPATATCVERATDAGTDAPARDE